MAICAAPIKGTVMRIVRLDDCCVPVTGTGSLQVVTKGFVQVQMEPQYEEGEEFFDRNADGDPCVNEKDDPVLKRIQNTIDFCEVDPAAAALILDARLLTEGTAVTGTGFAMKEGAPRTRYSLEVWQRVAGSGACDPSGAQRWIYNAWPCGGGTQLGTYTIENGRSTLQVISDTKAASPLWGDGPGTGPSYLPAGEVADDDEHWLWNITTEQPPEPQCGPMELV